MVCCGALFLTWAAFYCLRTHGLHFFVLAYVGNAPINKASMYVLRSVCSHVFCGMQLTLENSYQEWHQYEPENSLSGAIFEQMHDKTIVNLPLLFYWNKAFIDLVFCGNILTTMLVANATFFYCHYQVLFC